MHKGWVHPVPARGPIVQPVLVMVCLSFDLGGLNHRAVCAGFACTALLLGSPFPPDALRLSGIGVLFLSVRRSGRPENVACARTVKHLRMCKDNNAVKLLKAAATLCATVCVWVVFVLWCPWQVEDMQVQGAWLCGLLALYMVAD